MDTKLPDACSLERYHEKYEHSVKHVMMCSDAEPMSLSELLHLADPQCKTLWDGLSLGYTEIAGHPLLKQEIALVEGVSPDDVMVVLPPEGIYMAVHCLVDYLKRKNNGKPFHTVCQYPTYQNLYEHLKTNKCEFSQWSVRMTSCGWRFDLADLKTLITDNTGLLVVNFPHNPTGFQPTQQEWKELLEFCKQRDIFLFSDEIYKFTVNDGTEPIASACSQYDNSVTLGGLSKSFGLPGLRMGWLCTRNRDVMKLIGNFKDYLSYCPPAPCEILAIIALRQRDVILKRVADVVAENFTMLGAFFAKHADVFEWHRTRASTTSFVRIKGWLLSVSEVGGASGFCEELIKQQQVALLPSIVFDYKDEYVRVGVGRKNMRECLEQLEQFLNRNKPREN